MKKALLILAAIAGALTLNAQNKKGGIDAKLLGEISKGYEGTAADKALRNALNTTAINTLALNADNIPMDTRFSDVVKTKGRTNQLSSGRCWLFTGLNVMRAKMIDKFDMGPVILSSSTTSWRRRTCSCRASSTPRTSRTTTAWSTGSSPTRSGTAASSPAFRTSS